MKKTTTLTPPDSPLEWGDGGRNPNSETVSITEAKAAMPPKTINDIPLLGPIRIRALQKAGLGQLKQLREATLEQLMAVPGMSEVKARYIQDFLSQHPEREAAETETVEGEKKEADIPADVDFFPAGPADGDIPLDQEAPPIPGLCGQAMGQVTVVLMNEPASTYRGRLLREFARFLYTLRLLAPCNFSGARYKKVYKLVDEIMGAMEIVNRQPNLNRKDQTLLAQAIQRTCDRLMEIIGKARASSVKSDRSSMPQDVEAAETSEAAPEEASDDEAPETESEL